MPTQILKEYTGGGLVGASIRGTGFLLSPNSDGVVADSNGDNSANTVIYRAIKDEKPFFKIDPQGYVKQSDVDGLMISAQINASATNFTLMQLTDKTNQYLQAGDYILVGNSDGLGGGFTGENQEIIKLTSLTYNSGTGLYSVAYSKRGGFGTTDALHAMTSKCGRYIRGAHCDFFSSIKLHNAKVRIKKLVDYQGIDIIAQSGLSYLELMNGTSVDGKFIEIQRDDSYSAARGQLLIYRT